MNTAILNKSLMIISALLLFSATPLLAQVYKVVDKDGNVTYTDQPPADGSGPVELASSAEPSTGEPRLALVHWGVGS